MQRRYRANGSFTGGHDLTPHDTGVDIVYFRHHFIDLFFGLSDVAVRTDQNVFRGVHDGMNLQTGILKHLDPVLQTDQVNGYTGHPDGHGINLPLFFQMLNQFIHGIPFHPVVGKVPS
ncbi:hypothetical protein DESC_370234 [Desulfosarcina cetonica]|nr:hypothetical protein DESC_370234 [Desulfosarcina cetonica]